MKRMISRKNAFTLVELLIVIALIAILSVAVLATINPIEQANKARDSRVQNDAAEVMNAYERYYASNNKYPWMNYAEGVPASGVAYTLTDGVLLRSETLGFGICSSGADDPARLALAAGSPADRCDSQDAVPNELVVTSELKGSFAGKDEFEQVRDGTALAQALWLAKAANDNSIYVCYIPKAGANRLLAGADWPLKMRCLNDATTADVGLMERPTVAAAAGECGSVPVDDWAVPDTTGNQAMFRCVPE
jgi:prepilin-type N-terminal cleavage/methylation domain-containing protein